MAPELTLFDLDHTLLPIDSDHAFGDFIASQGLVDAVHYRARNDAFYADYQCGTLNIIAYSEFALSPLVGLPYEQLEQMHHDFMEEIILPAISPAARALVAGHLARGDLCAIVTGTNSFVTAPIARAFGIEHLLATVAAMEHGRITGQIRGVPTYREGKIVRVSAWLESMALALETMPRSTFYSDSHNDLPLLEKVTTPIATNPDATLRAAATARGWRILDLFEQA